MIGDQNSAFTHDIPRYLDTEEADRTLLLADAQWSIPMAPAGKAERRSIADDEEGRTILFGQKAL